LKIEPDQKLLSKSNSDNNTTQKQEICGLHERDIEIGEDELRNEHDFYLVNLSTNRLIQGRFVITRLKAVFVPYDKEIFHDSFLK